MSINFKTWILLLWGCVLGFAAGRARAERPIVVDVYAIPGATMPTIKNLVLQTEFPGSRHDIWIIEGGVNDIFTYGASTTETMRTIYLRALGEIGDHARACGVKAFFQELTPVIPEIVDPWVTWSAPPYQPKIEFYNRMLAEYVSLNHFDLIRVYQDFKPHWVAAPGSWCIYQNSDSVHPSAPGNRALGRAWAEAIAGYAMGLSKSPVRVAVFGDSIPAAVNFPAKDRPQTWLEYYANNVVPVGLARFAAE